MSPPRHPWVVGVDLGGSNLRVAAYRDLGAAAAAARTAGRALAQAPAAPVRTRGTRSPLPGAAGESAGGEAGERGRGKGR